MGLRTVFLNKEPCRSPVPSTCSLRAAGKPQALLSGVRGADEPFVWKKGENSTEHFLRAASLLPRKSRSSPTNSGARESLALQAGSVKAHPSPARGWWEMLFSHKNRKGPGSPYPPLACKLPSLACSPLLVT